MGIYVHFISVILIYILIEVILVIIDKQNSKELLKNLEEEHIVLRLPKVYRWIGYIGILLCSTFLFCMIYFPNETDVLWVRILFGLAILVGLFLVIASITWRIEVFRHEDYFIYRTWFCKTYTIHYNECISYKWTENQIILKTDKKKFRIDIYVTNFEYLIDMLKQHRVKEILK